MDAQGNSFEELYRLTKADSTETIPCYFEEDIKLHELKKLQVVDQHQQVLAMLNCFYANTQLNHQEHQILVDFLDKKLGDHLASHDVDTISVVDAAAKFEA
ncbi:hypothetical protein Aduo_008381 [Ancylostoma duodenale]